MCEKVKKVQCPCGSWMSKEMRFENTQIYHCDRCDQTVRLYY